MARFAISAANFVYTPQEEGLKNGRIEGLKPYGLTFHNFVTDNDVQILNSDTTEISVSKDLAEKLGITSFVNHCRSGPPDVHRRLRP